MIKIMDKVLGIMMLLMAIYTLYIAITPNHLYIN
jgi:hypothetical protein